ncbi:NUDIX domain-containing protein [Hyalangium versicolor]|uniref:NUDIX domain-containing protein n=1 Tax=Hyalangium versicolor TaxID=2861190 RepID=UPI001CCD428A|nr:NUDIX domain-containing protein [Hyalangium versicolor]
MNEHSPLMVLVAGPYRSGTGDEPAKIAANVRAMNEVALEVFRAGHLPVTGEAMALPLIELAGSRAIGDRVFDEIFHPVGRRLVERCDAVLRIGGASAGADEMVSLARAHGKAVYFKVEELPQAGKSAQPPVRREPGGFRDPLAEPSRNESVRFVDVQVLSSNWYVLRKVTFDYQRSNGTWSRQSREAYDRGNGATLLLHDASRGMVLLTRQFRLPSYVNGNPDGMLIEAPAGLLDGQRPEEAIRREVEEETGVRVGEVKRVFDAFMSPGSVTERLHFFAAPYTRADRVSAGGGLESDGEDIEVLELPLTEALRRVDSGEISDAKTIMLLQWAERHGVMGSPRC